MLINRQFFLCGLEYFSGSRTKLGGLGFSRPFLRKLYRSPRELISSSCSIFIFSSCILLNRSTDFAYPFGMIFGTSFSNIFSRCSIWSCLISGGSSNLTLYSFLDLDRMAYLPVGYLTLIPYRLAFSGSSGLIFGLKVHFSLYSFSSICDLEIIIFLSVSVSSSRFESVA